MKTFQVSDSPLAARVVLKYTQIFGGLHHNCPITGHCSSVNQEQSGHPADVADDATKSIFYLQTKNVGKSILSVFSVFLR